MGILLGAIIVMLIVMAVILGWSLAVGWLLAALLPFNLFEGTLLALLASIAGLEIFFRTSESTESSWDDNTINFHEIPKEKFFKSPADHTYENWVRYELANAMLYEFKALENRGQMSDDQLEALAIRLTDPVVMILKRKTGRSAHLEVTLPQLRNQLKRMDQQPYDDDLMQAAVEGVNLTLTAGPMEYAVRKKMWSHPAPIVVSD